ncbi:MAG: helix-turn-helix domain-containing protein [Terricaulis sp.]
MRSDPFRLTARDTAAALDTATVKRVPFTLQHVFTPRTAGWDFAWDGSSAYLALHDLVLADGELDCGELGTVRQLDLRRRMTFLPADVSVKGWSEPTERSNSFTMLAFDQNWLFEELEIAPTEAAWQPRIYFRDPKLHRIMEELQRVARAPTTTPRLMADSLAFLASSEVVQVLSRSLRDRGRLEKSQLAAAVEFMDAHLAQDVSLADIAQAAGLSVFHFSRAFKSSTGVGPYRYLLERRIDRARELISSTSLPVALIGTMVGFKTASHFSRSFTEIVGISPRAYRSQA